MRTWIGAAVLLAAAVGCGKKGEDAPPAPPKEDSPEQKLEMAQKLRRLGETVHIQDSLPVGFIAKSTNKPGLSWRVALLWGMGDKEKKLYNQFKIEEPWDSEHNKALIAQMPDVFKSNADDPAGTTRFRAFSGQGALAIIPPEPVYVPEEPISVNGPDPKAKYIPPPPPPPMGAPKPLVQAPPFGPSPFAPPRMPKTAPAPYSPYARGHSIGSTPDGTSNTILIAELAEPMVWTKPDELDYDEKMPLPKFGGTFAGGFHILMADGSVRFVPYAAPEATLRAIITRDGKEKVTLPGEEVAFPQDQPFIRPASK